MSKSWISGEVRYPHRVTAVAAAFHRETTRWRSWCSIMQEILEPVHSVSASQVLIYDIFKQQQHFYWKYVISVQKYSRLIYVHVVHSCDFPDYPPDGHVDCPATPANQVPVLGEVCRYSCDEGYTLVGSSERVCQIDGSFSGDAASCESKWHWVMTMCHLYQVIIVISCISFIMQYVKIYAFIIKLSFWSIFYMWTGK